MEEAIVYQKGTDPGWHFYHRPLGLMLIIAYRAIWGFIELCAGIAIIFSKKIIARELLEDPEGLVTSWLVTRVHLDARALMELGVIIATIGIIELILAAGLWYRSYAIRNASMVFFGILGIYALYHVLHRFTPLRLIALVVDALTLYYLWKVLPKHFKHGEVV